MYGLKYNRTFVTNKQTHKQMAHYLEEDLNLEGWYPINLIYVLEEIQHIETMYKKRNRCLSWQIKLAANSVNHSNNKTAQKYEADFLTTYKQALISKRLYSQILNN